MEYTHIITETLPILKSAWPALFGLLYWPIRKWKRSRARKLATAQLTAELDMLPDSAKSIIQRFIAAQQSILDLPPHDPPVKLLVNLDHLVPLGPTGRHRAVSAYFGLSPRLKRHFFPLV